VVRSTILFDGALPHAKRAERLARTEQNNRRIQQLRASYATDACPIPTFLGTTSYAFLAPSLRETLAASPFASRTRLVPGEADDSCALLAKNIPRSIIFTSDTDLLLFDYQSETLIVLFQDAESPSNFKAHSPSVIAKKFQLQSLVPFAYAIQQRNLDGHAQLLLAAQGIDVDSAPYVEFRGRYIAAVVDPVYLARHSSLPPEMQVLDVRISEFVHQALLGDLEVSVYLPLLVEDPNQASAWNVAQEVRTVAHSILTPSSTIHEYRRKAQHVSPQDINCYTAQNLQVPIKETVERVTASVRWAESRAIDTQLLWPLFALSLVLGELNTPPAVPLVMRVLNGDFDNSWTFVQLTARLHAAIYSLRILKQTVAIWLAINENQNSALYESLSRLQKQMSSLPSIADSFMVPGQAKRVRVEPDVLRELVEEIYTSVGVEVPVEQVSNKKKKRQAREADRKKRKMDQRQQGAAKTPKSGNGFALLHNDS